MRREARECAFKIIFETLCRGTEEETQLEVIKPLKKDADKEFCKLIFDTYQIHREKLEYDVSTHLKNFDITRVYKIDLALVFMALTEIEFLDTPKPVAINEALEISKKYSTNDSSKFINGLLSAILS